MAKKFPDLSGDGKVTQKDILILQKQMSTEKLFKNIKKVMVY